MPRPLRIEYPGARYHLMSRGDRREAIFHDDEDRRRFLATLGELCWMDLSRFAFGCSGGLRPSQFLSFSLTSRAIRRPSQTAATALGVARERKSLHHGILFVFGGGAGVKTVATPRTVKLLCPAAFSDVWSTLGFTAALRI